MHCRILSVAVVATILAFQSYAEGHQARMIDEVMADTVTFAAAIDTQIRRIDDRAPLRDVETVLPDMANSSEWRFHSRQGGLLVAIPVTRNLTASEKYGGEREVVDVVERLIRQRGFSGRVQVVFIEPAAMALLAGPRYPQAFCHPQPPVVCTCH